MFKMQMAQSFRNLFLNGRQNVMPILHFRNKFVFIGDNVGELI